MKKKLSALVFVLILLVSLTCPVLAAPTEEQLVLDASGLLTQDEVTELNDRALQLTQQYKCETLIVTIPSTEGMSIQDCCEYLFHEYALGYGEQQSCVMLLLATESREFNIMAYGYGNTAFTDWGKATMEERFLPYLSDDDYATAFSIYLDCCEEFLQMADAGTPFDVDTDPNAGASTFTMTLIGLGIGILLPLLIALIVCQTFKAQMKTAKPQKAAHNYITREGLLLTAQTDTFVNTTRTVIKIDNDNNRGGTSINSGGFSHHGGRY